ncbi:MAG: hypothetical protein KDB20_10430, partial [Microthrixaceae bacterium]|nr:hypothetical protein [Microthrixaceae bacterium]
AGSPKQTRRVFSLPAASLAPGRTANYSLETTPVSTAAVDPKPLRATPPRIRHSDRRIAGGSAESSNHNTLGGDVGDVSEP